MTNAPRRQPWIRLVFRAAILAVPVGLGCFLLFLALAYASLGADRSRLSAQVRAGFETGQLRGAASWRYGDTDLGAHQYNDCLILFQAIDDRAPALARALSPLSVPIDTDLPCARLETLVTRGADAPPRPYHQYLHAHTTLARALVPPFGVRGTRELYKLVISLLLLAGVGYAGLELARGREGAAPRATQSAWLAIFLVFARLFGFESFGQSLGHAPADMAVLGYLLFVSRASVARPMSRRAALVGAAVFGALTMEFEFLTGGLPLGLALVLGTVPLAVAESVAGWAAIQAACAYVTAAATCILAKLAAVTVVFGAAPLTGIMRQLLFRTGIAQQAVRDEPATGAVFWSHVWAGLDALAPGMHWLVLGAIGLALVAGGWGYRRLRGGSARERQRAVALAGSNVVILTWLVLFWQHTAEHAWFMDRLLVWPVASGAALFALASCQIDGDDASGDPRLDATAAARGSA